MKVVKTMLCAAALIAGWILSAKELQTCNKVEDWEKNDMIYEEDGLLSSERRVMMTGKIFDVDPAKTYTIKCSARAKDIKGNQRSMVYFGFLVFDKKGVQITCEQVNVLEGTFTEVVEDAPKGARTFLVKDGSKFKNAKHEEGASTIVKNAQEDFSDLPNRSSVSKGRILKAVKKAGVWEITLSVPLSVDLKAGEKIRVHTSGGLLYIGGVKPVGGEWVDFKGSISGISDKGWSYKNWPAGTAKAKLLILSNWRGKNLTTQFKNVTLTVK